MKTLIITFITFISLNLFAQDIKTEEIKFKVFGNCNMCKNRIEKSVSIPEVKFASWNKNTKNLHLIYESSITLDSLQKRIALAGHDNGKFKAQDTVYKMLPKCCLYRDNNKTH